MRICPTCAKSKPTPPTAPPTISMRPAWQIAAEAGVISAEQCRALIAAQAAVIDRELASPRCAAAARETLGQMHAEYRDALAG